MEALFDHTPAHLFKEGRAAKKQSRQDRAVGLRAGGIPDSWYQGSLVKAFDQAAIEEYGFSIDEGDEW